MVTNYQTFNNITVSADPTSMAQNFDAMINNVVNMIKKEGPTYTTWIRFQVGKKNPVTFSTNSKDKLQNLIADLQVEKSGAGMGNTFTLQVRYDPFNYGQSPSDKIELLDELVANAMSFDINASYEESDGLDNLRGYIQYGYSSTTDTKLISPKYEFILTNAESTVDMKNGITSYTFYGTSDLCIDCDFNVPFPEFKGKNLMEVITTVLYSYYGDPEHKPNHIIPNSIDYVENDYKYQIEINESLYTEAQIIDKAPTSAMSPWQYCKNLFDSYISASDSEKTEYQDLSKLKTNERPYYTMYLTDIAGQKTIHVNYISPKTDDNVSLAYEFTWGLDKQSIVQEWRPQVDLQLYLIRKAIAIRENRIAEINPSNSESTNTFLNSLNQNWWASAFNNNFKDLISGLSGNQKEIDIQSISSYIKKFEENSEIVDEMYDAELTILGIPADIPVCCEVRIKPRILSSISRTAGIYRVNGCTDSISSNGIFTTSLKLLRIKNLD